jgi:hypothetical protein
MSELQAQKVSRTRCHRSGFTLQQAKYNRDLSTIVTSAATVSELVIPCAAGLLPPLRSDARPT